MLFKSNDVKLVVEQFAEEIILAKNFANFKSGQMSFSCTRSYAIWRRKQKKRGLYCLS